MADSGHDPVESAAKGAVEGFLNWSKEQLVALARKIENNEIGFVEDKPTAEAIRKQGETSEFKLLEDFIPKDYLRVVVKVGLTLRGVENDRQTVEKLKNATYAQFGTNGVRIAELVQIGIISQLVTHLVKIYRSPKDVQKKLVYFLEQVTQLAVFVGREDLREAKRYSDIVKMKVETNPSQMVIVFGRGEKAVRVVLKILNEIKADTRRYVIKTEQTGYQLTAFIFAPEVGSKISTRWDTLTDEE